jgi:class 3 adenylate cyclase
MALHHDMPQDRLRALARGQPLPERCAGAALFADISGFTALTEVLRRSPVNAAVSTNSCSA